MSRFPFPVELVRPLGGSFKLVIAGKSGLAKDQVGVFDPSLPRPLGRFNFCAIMNATVTRVIASLLLLALGACADTGVGPTYPSPQGSSGPLLQPGAGETFNEGDFAWSRAAGAGSIVGVLTFHDGGTRYSCRGRDVILTPETPWVRRRMFILYGSIDQAAVPADIVRARTPASSSGDYASYARKTTCDSSNRFNFQGLPDGGWYVITLARPDDGTLGTVAVMRRVEVRGTARTITLD